jgi:thioredoxin reductase (NADPH)
MDFDCIVVGGGPAGLTAAIYLARYRRRVALLDIGQSRAVLIPKTRNYPGFAHGIAGSELLEELRRQAGGYGVAWLNREVKGLDRHGSRFTASVAGGPICAPTVLLATGLVDKKPTIGALDEVDKGALVRYCPICDGYEAIDKDICVLGRVEEACGKALFLRTYSRSVSLLTLDGRRGCEDTCRDLSEAGVDTPSSPVLGLRQEAGKIVARLADGSEFSFDLLYPILGCAVRSELGARLGALRTDAGSLVVDEYLQTTVKGLYAAGDVVSDLHQIAVATGHAAIAATHIHNILPRNFR